MIFSSAFFNCPFSRASSATFFQISGFSYKIVDIIPRLFISRVNGKRLVVCLNRLLKPSQRQKGEPLVMPGCGIICLDRKLFIKGLDSVFGFSEIQKSPNYESGFALRFPRFVRIRDDKSIDEIETLESINARFHQKPSS
jgi:hypothetical protein